VRKIHGVQEQRSHLHGPRTRLECDESVRSVAIMAGLRLAGQGVCSVCSHTFRWARKHSLRSSQKANTRVANGVPIRHFVQRCRGMPGARRCLSCVLFVRFWPFARSWLLFFPDAICGAAGRSGRPHTGNIEHHLPPGSTGELVDWVWFRGSNLPPGPVTRTDREEAGGGEGGGGSDSPQHRQLAAGAGGWSWRLGLGLRGVSVSRPFGRKFLIN
jgi:hypothetical protein